MNNTTQETDIGVRPEDQKSKTASQGLLPQTKNGRDPVSMNGVEGSSFYVLLSLVK